MIRLRSGTRAWQDLLEEAWAELRAGRPVDAGRLAQACGQARQAVNDAFDEGLYEGLWWTHPRQHNVLAPELRIPSHPRFRNNGWDITDLGDALAYTTSVLVEAAHHGPPLTGELQRKATAAFTALRAARNELAAHILNHLKPDTAES
ncbi:hypothetical protein GCM10022244_29680 [Streptomyces gulbargensis]|uniref:Uncharacterized protein n=1 Tax=Streptomyces gulbargensis TaxID=364901 RepID=A0ABP7MB05_9ACTN